MKIGNRDFDVNSHTYVMGILNVTPDSFSDGGKYNSLDAALKHTEQMIKDGADIIDVGGESTRPGHIQIYDEEEIERIVPVIEAIREQFDIPVSLDTYKSKVAEAGFDAGADLLNDIWGLKYDKNLAGVIAKHKKPCCLMHNRNNTVYIDYMQDVLDDLRETVRIARDAGIADEQIILDPGIGFGKDYEQNLIALNHLDVFHELGFPMLLGTSRKSVIGLTLDVSAQERTAGTVATTALAVMKHYSFVRVHDVKENVHAIRMTEAILRS